MTIIIMISLLLVASLLPHLTFTAHVGIVNGSEAKPHTRPYMVSIQLDGRHICGGSLISEEFVLTAAHCWNKAEILTVVVGAHDLREIRTSDHIGVKSYIPHPSYTNKCNWNDIMLLKLQEKVAGNSYVKWISLPKKGENVEAGALCSVAGWGSLKMNGSLSDRLMEANVYVMNNRACEKRWKEAYNVNQMMCTKGSGGSCTYDSGGPLVCGGIAVGVTSFGYRYRCNSLDYPNVYIKISTYIQWIDHEIKNKN